MSPRVVVLGGGVGGTLVANLIAKRLRKSVTVTVVDRTGMHVYQPGFLYVALDEANALWLARDERGLLRKDVELVIDDVSSVDPLARSVSLQRGGTLPYDFLVVATGSRLDRDAVPGYGGTHDFYSLEGAQRLREELRRFRGGRILVGVAGIPYKCPPAPVEFVLMLDQYLRARGIRERSEIRLLSPLNRAFTVEPASKLVQPIMDRKGIQLTTLFNVDSVDETTRTVSSFEGETFGYDLLILVPPHRGAGALERSGLTDAGGWIPTDRATLQHRSHERIFAIGDATDLPISKSGSTAHFEAPVVAGRIASLVHGTDPKEAYGGRVMCFLEVGEGKATALRFDYANPPVPPRPSWMWHWAKWAFNRAYWVTVPQGRIG